jgi:diguanylate cyclase (GGDEF)-like protein
MPPLRSLYDHIDSHKPVRTFLVYLNLLVFFVVSFIFLGIYLTTYNMLMETVLSEARSYFGLIVKTREWNAKHGGLYVVKGGGVETNELLRELDEGTELATTDGKVLTMRNPAMMTREISEILADEDGVKFRMTSLKPISMHNAPDGFEERSLKKFESGETEVWEVEDFGVGQPLFRYMAPLYTTEACLRCHERHGYKVGDVRGGISISIPLGHMQHKLGMIKLLIAGLTLTTLAFLLGTLYFLSSKLITRLNLAQEKLKHMSVTDELTGIGNRRYILERLKEEFDRARRSSEGLGVMLIDLDLFKDINDTYGHPFGDEVIRETAKRIRDCVRKYDMPARFGGEEFLVVAPGTDIGRVVELAERIRAAIEGGPVFGDGMSAGITASIGVSVMRKDDSKPDAMISRADKALYRAKDEGRNRVVSG